MRSLYKIKIKPQNLTEFNTIEKYIFSTFIPRISLFSIIFIANTLGESRQSVKRVFESLEKRGFIEKHLRGYRH
jgi:hypothetical protein